MHHGSCLCGGVRFTVSGDLAAPTLCHCGQCRKMAGHAWASTHVPNAALAIVSDTTLAWFASSATARRGFCRACGSSLFWDPADENRISVAMGAFDTPTGVKLAVHIFAASKGDYYELNDGLPVAAGFPDE